MSVRIAPVITEKSQNQITANNTYTFSAKISGSDRLNKTNIRRMVEEEYKVKVENVNVINRRGKSKRAGKYRQFSYYTGDTKFLLVKIKDGQTIPEFNVIKEEEK